MSELAGQSELLARIADLLQSGGYVRAGADPYGTTFEDAHSIVSVGAFDSISELIERWPEAQSRLVNLMSERLNRLDPKSWDGYLVLAASGVPTDRDQRAMADIEYDTSRVRKIVFADRPDNVSGLISDLRPLLPLDVHNTNSSQPASEWFQQLEEELVEQGLSREPVSAVLEAYQANRPLLEAIYDALDERPKHAT